MPELADSVYEQIMTFSRDGDVLAEQGHYESAIHSYNQAWELLPEPKNQWEAATWLLAAIGDSAFLGGFFKTARDAFDYAMRCPDAAGNPFLHLRRGQVLYEHGELDAAADELMRAFAMEGEDIFSDQDPKYLKFLGGRAELPPASPARKKSRFRRSKGI